MKTIPFYLVLIFFAIISNKVMAQDEFYNNKKTSETSFEEVDSIGISSYSTAEDYYANENKETGSNIAQQVIILEDVQGDKRRKERNGRSEFIADVVVNVFVNAVFILTTCWR